MLYSVLLGFEYKGIVSAYSEIVVANNRKSALAKGLVEARLKGYKGRCFSKIGMKV